MKLKLYQVYYEKEQPLDRGCFPFSTIGRDMAPYYENSIIKEISDMGKIGDCDYVGITSWRLFEKTGLTFDRLKKLIEDNPGYDVYTYGEYGNEHNLMQNKLTAIGIVWERIYQAGLADCKFNWINIFCNYWIIKKELLSEYVEFLTKVMNFLETDIVAKWICKSIKFPHREGSGYPLQTFVLEYCFGIWLVNNPTIKYKSLSKRLDNKEGGPSVIKKRALNAPEKTLSEIYKKHQSVAGHGDKGTLHNYIKNYDKLFTKYRHLPITLLEIGVCHGESVRMWREYFPEARIIGIDINKPILPMNDIEFYICNQADKKELNKVLGGLKFDIIIDDGSHLIEHQIFSLKHLWNQVNEGGIYVIEDMQNPESDIEALTKNFKKPDLILDTRKESARYDDMLLIWNK